MARDRYKVVVNYQGEIFTEYTYASSKNHALIQALHKIMTGLRLSTMTRVYQHVIKTPGAYEVILLTNCSNKTQNQKGEQNEGGKKNT